MKLLPPRIMSIGVPVLPLAAAVLLVGMGAGVASASSEPPDSGPTGDPAAPGCREVTGLLDTIDAFIVAYLDDDGEAIQVVLLVLPEQAAAATAAAPPEIADAVSTLAASVPTVIAALEGVDLTDTAAIDVALSSLPPDDPSNEADTAIREWAGTTCAWESSVDEIFAEPVEAQPCEILDAAAAAAAAGVDVDTSDSDGTGDFSLPGFNTKSCSYGNGAMALSTLSFNDLDLVLDFYMDNAEVLDVDLGSLPASTLVTSVDGAVTVSVFEATVPFSVTFTDDIEPAAVVAAAEAVFAGLPADVPPPPMSSESP